MAGISGKDTVGIFEPASAIARHARRLGQAAGRCSTTRRTEVITRAPSVAVTGLSRVREEYSLSSGFVRHSKRSRSKKPCQSHGFYDSEAFLFLGESGSLMNDPG